MVVVYSNYSVYSGPDFVCASFPKNMLRLEANSFIVRSTIKSKNTILNKKNILIQTATKSCNQYIFCDNIEQTQVEEIPQFGNDCNI